MVYAEPACAVLARDGVTCLCRGLAPDGTCLNGLGETETDEAGMGSGTSWVTGGLIILAAITVYALDKKGPAPIRRASS